MHSSEGEVAEFAARAREIFRAMEEYSTPSVNGKGQEVGVLPQGLTKKAADLDTELKSRKLAWKDIGLQPNDIESIESLVVAYWAQ